MKSLNTLLIKLHGDPDKRQETRQTIRIFFSNMWKEAGCTITPEILEFADAAYDAPIADVLADALGINLYDLRNKLGRNVVVKCENCNKQILIRELRVKHGYAVSGQNGKLCNKCKRDMQQQQGKEWAEYREDGLAVHQQRVAVDKLILKSPNDPYTMEIIKSHILEILTYWMNPRGSIFGEHKLGRACMMCNRQPVGIFLIVDRLISQQNGNTTTLNRLADSWLRHDYKYNQLGAEQHPWMSLQYPLQLIWRLEPYQLFQQTFLMPVKEFPVLFLCDDCMSVAQETHYEPYSDERWSIKY